MTRTVELSSVPFTRARGDAVAGVEARLEVASGERVGFAIALLVAGTAWAGVATERLAKARAAAAEVQYQSALKWAAGAIEAGDASADETWQLHVLRGELWAATGDAAAARRAFAAALSLHPDYRPAADVSPRIREPFERALAGFDGPLGVSAVQQRRAGDELHLAVKVEHDALGLVQVVRFEGAAGRAVSARRSSPGEYQGELACAGACAVKVVLLDEWGNALYGKELAVEALGAPPLQLPPPSAEVSERPPFYRRPGVYLAVAAVALIATGAIFGTRAFNEQAQLVALNDNRGTGSFADARSLDARRKQDYAVMWVGFGLGALGGVAAGWLW